MSDPCLPLIRRLLSLIDIDDEKTLSDPHSLTILSQIKHHMSAYDTKVDNLLKAIGLEANDAHRMFVSDHFTERRLSNRLRMSDSLSHLIRCLLSLIDDGKTLSDSHSKNLLTQINHIFRIEFD